MLWTRRQFGLWTTAALVLSPAQVWAGTGHALERVELDAALEGVESDPAAYVTKGIEAETATFVIHATNTGTGGLSLMLDVSRSEVIDGEATEDRLAWLNDNSPFSRRMMPPSQVDLPAGERMILARLHVSVPPAQRTPTARLHAEITLWSGKKSRAIELPPMGLLPTDKVG